MIDRFLLDKFVFVITGGDGRWFWCRIPDVFVGSASPVNRCWLFIAIDGFVGTLNAGD